MTIEEKLDLILGEIRDQYGRPPEDENRKRICRLITDGNGIDTGNDDYKNDSLLAGFINGLQSEGFIMEFEVNGTLTAYKVSTVKGLMFEGFVNQKVRREREMEALQLAAQDKKNQDFRLERIQHRITQLTWVVAIAAAISIMPQLINVWEYYYPYAYFRFW